MLGCGFTKTDTVNEFPIQFPASPDVGVTVYTIVCAILLVFTSVWLILIEAVVTFDSPVILGLSTTVQLYVVLAGTMPFVLFTGAAVNVSLLQIVVVIFVMAGFGFTLTMS